MSTGPEEIIWVEEPLLSPAGVVKEICKIEYERMLSQIAQHLCIVTES